MSQLNLMALRHSAFYSPYLMTMAGGYLQEAGFDVNYQVQTPQLEVKQRLLSGLCDISQSAVAAGFSSLCEGQEDSIRHFAQINSRDGFFIAARNPALPFDWQQLYGKKLIIDHFFQPLAMFRFALLKKGIEWNRLNIIDAGDVQQIDDSFRSGIGDFVHQQGPAPQQMEFDNIATVVASVGEAIGPVAFSSLCATEAFLASEKAPVFLHAYKLALKECQQTPAQEIAKKLQSYGFLTDIEFSVLSSTIKAYQALGCWKHDGSISQSEYETLLDVFEHSQLINQRYAYDKLILQL